MAESSDSSNLITEEELVSLSVADLNKRMVGLPPEAVARLKQRRKLLKMRSYAASSRVTKKEFEANLRQQWSDAVRENQNIKTENRVIEEDIRDIKSKYQELKDFARERNIPIPPELDLDCE